VLHDKKRGVLQNGSPLKVVVIDVSDLDNKNPQYVYTEEQARQRYGPDEGREFGDLVQICGTKLPKSRALKFVQRCGARLFAHLDNNDILDRYL
jgi:hypothetical protein